MDFKAPIDITAVLTAVKKHKNILKAVDKLDASEVLKHFTPVPGITDSLELGKVEAEVFPASTPASLLPASIWARLFRVVWSSAPS